MTKQTPPFNFEASLGELEAIVSRLESGDLPLEDSLQAFEQGIKLTRECQQQLSTAEQKVSMLCGEGDRAERVAFNGQDHTEE
ncbi:MAG: exodeoxyribonuclease VII small subunit [Cellvibrionaceae bacterium]|nr:exodeoxyribonuclease VII small subunit [Cellvibrionaceae bacterium]